MPKAAPVFRKAQRKAWADQGAGAPTRSRGRKGQELRKRRMLADNHLCRLCRAQGILRPANVVDHIKPLALGGTDTDDNCRALCGPCHDQVTAEQFGRRARPRSGLDGWPIADYGFR